MFFVNNHLKISKSCSLVNTHQYPILTGFKRREPVVCAPYLAFHN